MPLGSASDIATWGAGALQMDSITWPVAALAFATITLVLTNVGNEIRRRRRLKRYLAKVVAELRRNLA